MNHHPTAPSPTTGSRSPRPPRPLRGIDVPTTIWLPPARLPAASGEPCTLPVWARARLAAEHSPDSPAFTATWHPRQRSSLNLRPLTAATGERAEYQPPRDGQAGLVLVETGEQPGASTDPLARPYPTALGAARRALAPAGVLAIAFGDHVTGPDIDLLAHAVHAARENGFVYQQHLLIVTAAIDGDRLHPRPDLPARDRRRALPADGLPISYRAHRDLLLFTANA